MDEQRIAKIVEQVVKRLATSGPLTSKSRGRRSEVVVCTQPSTAAAAAKRAFSDLQSISLKDRARYIEALRQATLALPQMARMAVDETGLGRYEDKIEKNRLVANKTPGIESLRPDTWTGDDASLTEWAPYGVIGSMRSCTNPTETILNNGIGMLCRQYGGV